MFAQFRMGCKNSGGTDENADFASNFEQVALPPRLGKQYQAVKCHTKYPLHRTEIRLSWECQAPRTFTKAFDLLEFSHLIPCLSDVQNGLASSQNQAI